MTKDELISKLRHCQIAYGEVNSVQEFSSHPQLRRSAVATPNGQVHMPSPPAIVAQEGENNVVQELGAVPRLGEHTNLIHKEFDCR